MGWDVPTMVDANQAWNADAAISAAQQLASFKLDGGCRPMHRRSIGPCRRGVSDPACRW
jgi:hypothetical protein